jgi:predicted urease superfamily metal-dependent hydrolase
MEDLIKKLLEANSVELYGAASQACIAYFPNASDEEQQLLRKIMIQKAEEMMSQAMETRQKAAELIAEYENRDINIEIDGKKYPLSEWVTMKEYCRRFGLKNTMVINNWITREIIPKENILNISQLNNLRLIKAVPYKG